MGLFDFFKGKDINLELEEYKNSENSILLDVRTRDEYRQGHIPKSINIPLQEIEKVKDEKELVDKNKNIYVYCHGGGRSENAVRFLKQSGYLNVKNIGGILNYKGQLEK